MNSNDRDPNPSYNKLGIALKNDDPGKFLYARGNLFNNSVRNVKDILSFSDPDLSFVPGIFCTESVIRFNVAREANLNRDFK